MKHNKKPKNGFSLIEIITVIAIMGIITAIAVPAINSSLKDGRDRQADANTQALNQAASRARLAGKTGAGTYGSDKNAALDWYLNEALLIQKDYKIDNNSFLNGMWSSNYLGNINELEEVAQSGQLTNDQLSEILRRFTELSPAMLQALSDGGYLSISTAALSAANTNGNTNGLELYGNTLLTSEEMQNVMYALIDEADYYQSAYLSENWDNYEKDFIKSAWTTPGYESWQDSANWVWNEETQKFTPNFNLSWMWGGLEEALSYLPPGSSLYNQILDSYSIDDSWSFEEERANILPPEVITSKQSAAQTLQQAYLNAKPAIDNMLNIMTQIPNYTLEDIENIPITANYGNVIERLSTYTDPTGEVWTTYAFTSGIGTPWEYTDLNIFRSVETEPGVYINSNKYTYLTEGQEPFISGDVDWYGTDSQGNYFEQQNATDQYNSIYNDPLQMDIMGSNEFGEYGARINVDDIINNPENAASYLQPYSTQRKKTVTELNNLANEQLKYTDPEAYAQNIKL